MDTHVYIRNLLIALAVTVITQGAGADYNTQLQDAQTNFNAQFGSQLLLISWEEQGTIDDVTERQAIVDAMTNPPTVYLLDGDPTVPSSMMAVKLENGTAEEIAEWTATVESIVAVGQHVVQLTWEVVASGAQFTSLTVADDSGIRLDSMLSTIALVQESGTGTLRNKIATTGDGVDILWIWGSIRGEIRWEVTCIPGCPRSCTSDCRAWMTLGEAKIECREEAVASGCKLYYGWAWRTPTGSIRITWDAKKLKFEIEVTGLGSSGSGNGSVIDACAETCTRTPTPTPTRPPVPTGDTDRDGLDDSVEGENLHLHEGQSNRWLHDSDGDGLLDSQEDRNFSGLWEPGETHTRNRDTDGDRMGDGFELMTGHDPLVPQPGMPDEDNDELPGPMDPNPLWPDTDGDRFKDGYEFVTLGPHAVLQPELFPPLGDANGDRFVTTLDALVTQSLFLGLTDVEHPIFHQGGEPLRFRQLDINRDGFITGLDALVQQAYFMYLLQCLPL